MYSWVEKNQSSLIDAIVNIHHVDMGSARIMLGQTMATLATAETLGELVSLAIMIRCFATDTRHKKLESNMLMLDAYMVLKDTEIASVLDSVREMGGLDKDTLKEIIGQDKPDDMWESPGAKRLNPLNTEAIENWRNLWEMMCYVAVQREVDIESVEDMVSALPCTPVNHHTKRSEGQDLGEALAHFFKVWGAAEEACGMVDLMDIMPPRLTKNDSLVTAMTRTDEHRERVDYYLKHLAEEGMGVTRVQASETHIIDALYYAEEFCKPSVVNDLIMKKKQNRGKQTRACPASA